jgi:vacuolar-type H+-ATPase subunit H
VEASILSALERAERDAQDRRLEAEAAAARLLCDARDSARAVEAAAEERARAAVAALRDGALAAARDEARGIDAGVASVRRPDPAPAAAAARHEDDERFGRAVELVVAAVLGERDPTPAGSERDGPAGVAWSGPDAPETEAISC